MTDLLMVTDLGEDGLSAVLETAAQVKRDPGSVSGRLDGAKVGLFFQKPSTRTRVSCEVASVDLGAHPLILKQDEVGLGKREAVQDIGRVLDRYLDILAFRVFSHADLVQLAEYSEAPVINLLSDRSHPCQALADLQTIAENRQLRGSTVVYVGDGNNVAHSLVLAGVMGGMSMRVASPAGHGPDLALMAEAERIAAGTGGSVTVGSDVAALVAGADVVYTDVWTSMGDTADPARRGEMFAPYQVDEALLDTAADDAIFMHCLPAHRGEEVADAVMEDARSRVFDQAENRMHAFKALLLHVGGVAD